MNRIRMPVAQVQVPTAKKCQGENRWFPAFKSVIGPVVLEEKKFDSPAKARAAARRILAGLPSEEASHG